MCIFYSVTNELITDENEILATTLKYNIGVLKKNKIAQRDIPEEIENNTLHEKVMNDTTKGELISAKTYMDVLAHLKNKNKNMFRHINKAGKEFQDAMYVYRRTLSNKKWYQTLMIT